VGTLKLALKRAVSSGAGLSGDDQRELERVRPGELRVRQRGRELLKRGRLTEELQPPGFEALMRQQGVARGGAATEREAASR
jgi:hypothetical protein